MGHLRSPEGTNARLRSLENGLAMEVWRITSQSIPNDTITDIVWEAGAANSELGTTFWDDSDPTLITFPLAGMYAVILHVAFDDNANGSRYASINKVGYDGDQSGGVAQFHTVERVGSFSQFQLTTHLKVTEPGQQIRANVHQASGGALDLVSEFDAWGFSPVLMIYRIGSHYDRVFGV